MQLAAALPLGFTSECEIADIWLMEAMEPAVAQEQMMIRMAPGIQVLEVQEIPLSDPATQTLTAEAHYQALILDPIEMDELRASIAAFMTADTFPTERRGKRYDLRPLVINLGLSETEDGVPRIDMRLYLMPGKTGRPDEVVEALGLDPLAARIHRKAIILADEPLPIP
jgi:radical SAM-linked protein